MSFNRKAFRIAWSDFKHPYWIYQGLIWGVGMFVIMAILYPLIQGNRAAITLRSLVIQALFYSIGGVILYGGSLHLIYRYRVSRGKEVDWENRRPSPALRLC